MELNTMYTKPEIVVLGTASEVILGNGVKTVPSFESAQPTLRRYNPADIELDN